MITEKQIAFALANKGAVLSELDRVDAEKSLRFFVGLMFPVLEPTRALVGGWCLDAVCEHLQAITEGKIKDLVIAIPPGCMKSLSTCVFWPTWEWGPRNKPDRRFMTASYSTDLTYRDNRKSRRLIESPTYQKHWGSRFQFASDANSVERIETTKSGFRLATSVGGAGMGERIDVAVIDDPIKASDADSVSKLDSALRWFAETVSTRSTDPGKMSRVVIMQRLSERDIIGHVIAQELGYELLVLPMRAELDHPHARKVTSIGFRDPRTVDGALLWEERFSETYVQQLEKELGSHGVASQLQQRPAPRGGGMFKEAWLRVVDSAPTEGVAVRGWDLAATTNKTSAYTVGVKMRRTKDAMIYIEDVVRLRGSPHEVDAAILGCAKRDGLGVHISIPQDPGASGVAQKQAFARLLEGYDFSFSPESGSKADRARPLAAAAEGGLVFLVRGPWVDAWIAEAVVFPYSEYLDQVDASSRSFSKLLSLSGKAKSLPARPRFYSADLADDE